MCDIFMRGRLLYYRRQVASRLMLCSYSTHNAQATLNGGFVFQWQTSEFVGDCATDLVKLIRNS